MTVKCINYWDKETIALLFKADTSVKDLALMYGCSERTIRRVLEEYELVPVSRIKPAPIPTKPSLGYVVLRFFKNLFNARQPNV